jgi:hypothetical protein
MASADRDAARKLLDLAPSAAKQERHRDLRDRLPSASPPNRASRGNQDRYPISVDTSRTTALSALVVDRQR